MSLESAIAEEIARVEAEDAAARSRVERAGDEATAPPAPVSPAPGGREAEVSAVISAIEQLPPEVATPILIAAVDLIVKRVAGKKFALEPDEHELMLKVWTPAVRFYLPKLSVHPLAIPAIATGVIYGLKTLPPGALANLLGGGSLGAAAAAVEEVAPMPPQPVHAPIAGIS